MAKPGYRIGFGVAGGIQERRRRQGQDRRLPARPSRSSRTAGSSCSRRSSTWARPSARRWSSSPRSRPASTSAAFDIITRTPTLMHPHRSASGQRQTLVSGNAVVIAGKQFKKLAVRARRRMDRQERRRARRSWTTRSGPSGPSTVVEEKLMTLEEVSERATAEGIEVSATPSTVAPQTWPLSDQEARRTVPQGEVPQLPDVRLRHPGRDRRRRRGDRAGRPAPRDRRARRRRARSTRSRSAAS